MLRTLTQVLQRSDERATVLGLSTWRGRLDASLEVWLYRAGAWVFAGFAVLALVLAVVGVYGVKSYVVSRRTREFGIRLATGAEPLRLLWMVLREGMSLAVAGAGAGLLLALVAGRLLAGVLFGVSVVEPGVLLSAPALLLVVSLAAAYLPARRATRVDPMVALRAE